MRLKCSVILSALLAFTLQYCQLGFSKTLNDAKRYKFYRVEKCEENGENKMFAEDIKLEEMDGSYILSFNVTSLVPFDDNLSMVVDMAVWSDGGWRLNYMNFEMDRVCYTFRQYFPKLYLWIIKKAEKEECPISPGTYVSSNLNLTSMVAMENIPDFPHGRFMCNVNVFLVDSLIGCLRFFVNILPKERKKIN